MSGTQEELKSALRIATMLTVIPGLAFEYVKGLKKPHVAKLRNYHVNRDPLYYLHSDKQGVE